jgi:RNA polymerase sigma factor for flagellar operon FliA
MAQAATLEEQLNWQKWIKSRDLESGNYLIKKYLPLVSYHVQRISVSLPKSVSREDLRSSGMLGLYDALEKFDQSRDLKFDTYASFRIRGAILDGLRKEDWLPRNTRDKAKKIDSAIEKLEQQKMGQVSVTDIARELNMTEDEVYTTMNEQFFANVLSMDEQPLENEEKENHFVALKDKKAEIPEESLIKKELLDELAEKIEELSEKEQLIISLFYQEELTLTEIGSILNLSTSRISQIHSKALFKLRHSLEKIM